MTNVMRRNIQWDSTSLHSRRLFFIVLSDMDLMLVHFNFFLLEFHPEHVCQAHNFFFH
jgi:hypothetical protein